MMRALLQNEPAWQQAGKEAREVMERLQFMTSMGIPFELTEEERTTLRGE